jgi:hypothetical protein
MGDDDNWYFQQLKYHPEVQKIIKNIKKNPDLPLNIWAYIFTFTVIYEDVVNIMCCCELWNKATKLLQFKNWFFFERLKNANDWYMILKNHKNEKILQKNISVNLKKPDDTVISDWCFWKVHTFGDDTLLRFTKNSEIVFLKYLESGIRYFYFNVKTGECIMNIFCDFLNDDNWESICNFALQLHQIKFKDTSFLKLQNGSILSMTFFKYPYDGIFRNFDKIYDVIWYDYKDKIKILSNNIAHYHMLLPENGCEIVNYEQQKITKKFKISYEIN